MKKHKIRTKNKNKSFDIFEDMLETIQNLQTRRYRTTKRDTELPKQDDTKTPKQQKRKGCP